MSAWTYLSNIIVRGCTALTLTSLPVKAFASLFCFRLRIFALYTKLYRFSLFASAIQIFKYFSYA
jgi:hypothetical protein